MHGGQTRASLKVTTVTGRAALHPQTCFLSMVVGCVLQTRSLPFKSYGRVNVGRLLASRQIPLSHYRHFLPAKLQVQMMQFARPNFDAYSYELKPSPVLFGYKQENNS